MPNSVAVITGASQGIGRATALRLARNFSSLVLIARSEEHLQETAQKAKSCGAESLVLPLDLREAAAAEKVVNDTLARFGRIDALVNIAGAVPQIDNKPGADCRLQATGKPVYLRNTLTPA